MTSDLNSSAAITLVKLYKGKKNFRKRHILCVKKSIAEKFRKTDHRFGFLDPDHLRSTLLKKFFVKKVILCVKKLIRKKFKKLTPDSSSSTPITLRSTF
jgi:hypothetical protein